MIPKDLLRKIRHIEIVTNRLVTDSMAGNYESVFKGQGIAFSEVREYQYGDDIRSIDWNVSARQNKPFIKKFIEERERTVVLMVDLSASMRFATQGMSKKDMAAEVGALLAFSAIRNNDKVGLLLFSDQVEAYIPPSKQKQHILRIIRDVLYYKATHKQTNLALALEYFNRVIHKESILFIVSDFWSQNYERYLRIVGQRHDIIPISITDPLESEVPAVGKLLLEDSETKQMVQVDTSNAQVRQQLRLNHQELLNARKKLFIRLGLDAIELCTSDPYLGPIITFFQKRMKKR